MNKIPIAIILHTCTVWSNPVSDFSSCCGTFHCAYSFQKQLCGSFCLMSMTSSRSIVGTKMKGYIFCTHAYCYSVAWAVFAFLWIDLRQFQICGNLWQDFLDCVPLYLTWCDWESISLPRKPQQLFLTLWSLAANSKLFSRLRNRS